MSIKIAINGFGRIGRPVFRRIIDHHPALEVAVINDLTDNKTLAHLLKYDSLYGIYNKEISADKENIYVDGKKYIGMAEPDPEKLPWKKLGIDIVLECSGHFRDLKGAEKHIKAGAKKVIISAPAKDKEVRGFVLGVNADKYDPSLKIMDMGSCTTNCVAVMAKVLNDNFKIIKGFMTTVHSYTNDQRILDLPHKDLRRARAAALNIIPTSTGAARALGKMVPELEGKMDGIAMRVPTGTVSALDLVVEVENPATKEEVNDIFKKAANSSELKGILGIEEQELVSSDFKGNTHSAVVDLPLTMVKDSLIKTIGWYDNEMGYAARLAEFADFVGKKL